MTGEPAPGWYPDGRGSTRWWDGRAWTEHVQGHHDPSAGWQASGAEGALVAPRRSRAGLWIALAVAGAAAVLVVVAVAMIAVVVPAAIDRATTPDAGAATPAGIAGAGAGSQETAVIAVYDAYLAAWFANDCAAEAALATEGYRGGSVEDYCADVGAPLSPGEVPAWSYEITALEVMDHTATLTADEQVTWPDGAVEAETWTYSLVLVDGRWLVDAAW